MTVVSQSLVVSDLALGSPHCAPAWSWTEVVRRYRRQRGGACPFPPRLSGEWLSSLDSSGFASNPELTFKTKASHGVVAIACLFLFSGDVVTRAAATEHGW